MSIKKKKTKNIIVDKSFKLQLALNNGKIKQKHMLCIKEIEMQYLWNSTTSRGKLLQRKAELHEYIRNQNCR
jgi:hypothetical protein